ncbi:MAG: hypothetical protein O2966_01175 [Proteobacteria bacterium]|nr:hypothetical protein [Pseudomonadota bacterium]
MLSIKSIKMSLPLCVCAILALLSPALTQAEEAYESGRISSARAAEQRAALARKAEERKEKAAEKQKAAEAAKAVEVPKAVEAPKEAAPAK